MIKFHYCVVLLSKNVDSILRGGNTSKKKQKRSTVILILPDLTITESTPNAKGSIENERINTTKQHTYAQQNTEQNQNTPLHATKCNKYWTKIKSEWENKFNLYIEKIRLLTTFHWDVGSTRKPPNLNVGWYGWHGQIKAFQVMSSRLERKFFGGLQFYSDNED